MLRLLSIEWLKLKHYRTFWVLGAMYLVSVIGANYVGFYIEQRVKEKEKMISAIAGTAFGYPDLWQSVSYISSFLIFIPALLIITFVANEFTYKTHRQNIIDGWNRQQFISVKIMLVVLMSAAATIMVFLTVLLIGAIGGSSFTMKGSQYLLYFFIQSLSYGSLALLIAVLVKRTGLALGIFLLYAYILENFIGSLLNWKLTSKPGHYLPLNVTDDLIPFPFAKNLTKRLLEIPSLTVLLIVSALYLGIYLFFATRKFLRSDL